MAHQAHAICWNILVANLKYQPQRDPHKEVPANIVFRFQPNQGKDMEHFANSLVRNLTSHTVTERRKYPSKYETSGSEDLLVSDAVAKRINPTVYRWRVAYAASTGLPVKWSERLCSHHSDTSEPRHRGDRRRRDENDDGFKFSCSCPLPIKERKTAAFIRQYSPNDCYHFYTTNRGVFLNMELVKTLLLYGEMDPILRICSHPDVDYAQWQRMLECYDTSIELGWSPIYQRALDAYIALNLIYCFPALWDPGSGCQRQGMFETLEDQLVKRDEYRNTAIYQRMLEMCTRTAGTVVPTYPHQEFFGIPDDHFRDYYRPASDIKRGLEWPALMKLTRAALAQAGQRRVIADRGEFPFGQVPFDIFLNYKRVVPHLPSATDISQVTTMLHAKGLPSELVLQILRLGGYDTVQRRLPMAHDPFHPENRGELKKYLTFCWLTLIRCNMFAQELGIEIQWKLEIIKSLARLVGSPPGRRLYTKEYNEEQDRWMYRFLDAAGRHTHTFYTGKRDGI